MSDFPHHNDPHYVYRCYDASGRLLYIGCTYNPPARMRQHSQRTPWFGQVARVRFLVFPNRHFGLQREQQAIMAEHPIHNQKYAYAQPDPAVVAAQRERQLEWERSGISARDRKAESLRQIVAARKAAS